MKKKYIRFWDLPMDLQNHLFTKCLLCVAGYAMSVVFYLYTGMLKECLVLISILCLYVFYVISLFYKVLRGKVYVYEGVCEKKCGKEMSFKVLPRKATFFTTWTYCYLVIKVVQGDKEIKIKVPCGYRFNADEGSLIRVYSFESRIQQENGNTCRVNNPFLVSLIKT